jgi:hypothetical protein
MIKTLILQFSSSVHAPEMTGRKWPQKHRADLSIRPLPTDTELTVLDFAQPPEGHQASRTQHDQGAGGGFGDDI